MEKSKLKIEKFRILELTNPSNIRGGTGAGSTTIDTMGSDNTTYTTDPNVQCPLTTAAITTTAGSDPDPTGTTSDTINDPTNTRTTLSGGGVPTFGP